MRGAGEEFGSDRDRNLSALFAHLGSEVSQIFGGDRKKPA